MSFRDGLPPRWVGVVMALVIVGSLGLTAYGQWTEDVCITDERAWSVPEGSSGTTRVVAWPPGGVRCDWKTPQGADVSFTVVPIFDSP